MAGSPSATLCIIRAAFNPGPGGPCHSDTPGMFMGYTEPKPRLYPASPPSHLLVRLNKKGLGESIDYPGPSGTWQWIIQCLRREQSNRNSGFLYTVDHIYSFPASRGLLSLIRTTNLPNCSPFCMAVKRASMDFRSEMPSTTCAMVGFILCSLTYATISANSQRDPIVVPWN